ncbi:MAG: radical SAM protein [Deltaproteobacteria bacterium]|nr:radical SAM protein [Deltaproteobacteria bacterium]
MTDSIISIGEEAVSYSGYLTTGLVGLTRIGEFVEDGALKYQKVNLAASAQKFQRLLTTATGRPLKTILFVSSLSTLWQTGEGIIDWAGGDEGANKDQNGIILSSGLLTLLNLSTLAGPNGSTLVRAVSLSGALLIDGIGLENAISNDASAKEIAYQAATLVLFNGGRTERAEFLALRKRIFDQPDKVIHRSAMTRIIDKMFHPIPLSQIYRDVPDSSQNMGVYIHIPFCPTICSFCGFKVDIDKGDVRERYSRAVANEIEQFAKRYPNRKVEWIYFGGGTPGTLTEAQLERIVTSLKRLNVSNGLPFTMEVRVDSITEEKMRAYMAMGINRFSVGVQTFDPKERQDFNLVFSPDEVLERLRILSRLGVEYNIDLIFGAPGQTLEAWQRTVQRALQIRPNQITTYAYMPISYTTTHRRMTGEESRWSLWQRQKGMIDLVREEMQTAGYRQSDTFVFSREGAKEYNPYADTSMIASTVDFVGFGPSAYSFFGPYAYVNPYDTVPYMRAIERGDDLTVVGIRNNPFFDALRKVASLASNIQKESRRPVDEGGSIHDAVDSWSTYGIYRFWTFIYSMARCWNMETLLVGYSPVAKKVQPKSPHMALWLDSPSDLVPLRRSGASANN